jgi:hypothetical protein
VKVSPAERPYPVRTVTGTPPAVPGGATAVRLVDEETVIAAALRSPN